MIETGHKSFPVVENDRVVGIVAREDILRASLHSAFGASPAKLVSAEREGLFEATELYERLQTKIGGEREWCK